MILPQNLSDIGGTVAALAKILDGTKSSTTVVPGSPPPLR